MPSDLSSKTTSSLAHSGSKTCTTGWHAKGRIAPHRGVGTATVGPIRRLKDIEAIKQALAQRQRDLTLFTLGIHFGLRGSDLLALSWDKVLNSDNTIRRWFEVREGKTGKMRRVLVQPKAMEALELWYEVQNVTTRSLIFPSRNGGRLTIQRLHQLVNAWTELVNLKGNFGSHTLRKTFGYQLRQFGVGIETVMKIFGHTSQSVTLRYLGIDQDETDEACLKLNL